jgi:hypothetical protein
MIRAESALALDASLNPGRHTRPANTADESPLPRAGEGEKCLRDSADAAAELAQCESLEAPSNSLSTIGTSTCVNRTASEAERCDHSGM